MRLKVTVHVPELADVLSLLRTINRRIQHMATQDDITRLTEQVTAATGRITSATTAIRQDIADLKTANPGLDTTALEESVATLTAGVGGLEDLDAENPTPGPVL